MLTPARHPFTFGILAIVAVAVLLFALSAITGYRVGPGFTLVKGGTLVLADLVAGSSLYIDDAYKGVTRTEQRLELTPGNHTVIVSAPGMQPWNEIVAITAEQETRVRPIFVPKEITPLPLSAEKSREIAAHAAVTGLPTKEAPLPMLGGCALVYADAGRVLALGTTTPSCTPPPYLCSAESCNPTIIYSSTAGVSDIIPFPGRDDALVIAAGIRVFALELDPRTPEFFAPLVRGTAPRAFPLATSSIMVLDGVKAFEVRL